MEPEPGSADGRPVAAVEGLWKSFGGIPVLKGVDIDVRAGEIHALAGGNGAGKSTLMKAITGVVAPDAGRITIGGNEVRLANPRAAQANAVYMVPQEPQLFPNLSVLENVTLSLGGIRTSRAEVKEVLSALGHLIDLDAKAHELSISGQQLIEIVRGILRKARLLIVDEPTAALTAHEADQLFIRLRALAASGVGIFYVTHRMTEIFTLCDRVTVLRDGSMVLQKETAETSVGEVVSAMIPDSEQAAPDADRAEIDPDAEPALVLRGLTGQGFADVSLDVRPGEILGVAGVVGAGRTELAETVFGLRPGSGEVLLGGEAYERRSPKRSMARGLSYVAEDRHAHGVFLLGSIVENCTSTVLPLITRLGLVRESLANRLTDRLSTQLAVQKGDRTRKVANLSGGNQQKVSLAKSLAPGPRIIILDEPSRGVDVGARADLYRLIRELADQGRAVLLISSDFEEIVELATRVVIMHDGHVGEELRGEQITFAAVRNGAFGTQQDEVAA